MCSLIQDDGRFHCTGAAVVVFWFRFEPRPVRDWSSLRLLPPTSCRVVKESEEHCPASYYSKAQFVQLASGLIRAALELSITEIRRLDGVVRVHEPSNRLDARESAAAAEAGFQSATAYTIGAPSMQR